MAVERQVAAPPSTNQLCVKMNNSKKNAEKINSSSDDIRKMKGREYSIRPRTQSDFLIARNMKGYAGAEYAPAAPRRLSSPTRIQTGPAPMGRERNKKWPIKK